MPGGEPRGLRQRGRGHGAAVGVTGMSGPNCCGVPSTSSPSMTSLSPPSRPAAREGIPYRSVTIRLFEGASPRRTEATRTLLRQGPHWHLAPQKPRRNPLLVVKSQVALQAATHGRKFTTTQEQHRREGKKGNKNKNKGKLSTEVAPKSGETLGRSRGLCCDTQGGVIPMMRRRGHAAVTDRTPETPSLQGKRPSTGR